MVFEKKFTQVNEMCVLLIVYFSNICQIIVCFQLVTMDD
jgi:hypothetical protein